MSALHEKPVTTSPLATGFTVPVLDPDNGWRRADTARLFARAPAKIACLGDSLSSIASYDYVDSGVTNYVYDGASFMTWANVFLDQRLHFEHGLNFGVAGDTAAMIAARVGDVIEAAPDVCIVDGGGNDAIQQIEASVTIAALEEIYEALIAAGILVVALPIIPQGASWWAAMDPEEAETQRARVNNVNRWIRQYAREHAGILMADPIGALVDMDSAESIGLVEMYHADGLHPAVMGGQHIGMVVADVIATVVAPTAPRLPEHNIDVVSAENPGGNLIANGMMLGTGGSVLTEPTGDVADGWVARRIFGSYGAGTVVASKQTRTDGVGGEWQVLTLAGLTGGSDAIYGIRCEVDGADGLYAQGDVVEAECEIQVEGASYVHSAGVTIREYDGSGSAVTTAETGKGTNDRYTASAFAGIFRTPQMPIAAALGASSKLELDITIRVQGDLGAAAVMRIGRVALRKVVE